MTDTHDVGARLTVEERATDAGGPLFLQAKEAEASVLERALGKSEFADHGQRSGL